MLGPVPEIEHAIRWQIRGIEIAQQRAAQLVVDVQQGARFDGLQPRQRLCVRESDAVLPGLIGGHPKVAGCCAVLDPRRQRWTQAGHGFAVPEGVEQAVDEAEMPAVAARLAQQGVKLGGQSLCGQGTERMADPAGAQPRIALDRCAQGVQQVHALARAERRRVAVEHEAQGIDFDQSRPAGGMVQGQPGPQPAQRFDRRAVDALHQRQHAPYWEPLRDAPRQCPTTQVLGDAAVARHRNPCVLAEDLARERCSRIMQLEICAQVRRGERSCIAGWSGCKAALAAQQGNGADRSSVVQKPLDVVVANRFDIQVLLVVLRRQLPACRFVDGGARARARPTGLRPDRKVEQQRVTQQLAQAVSVGGGDEGLRIWYLLRA